MTAVDATAAAHDEQLLRRWIGLAGEPAARYGSELIDRYREPQRRYHTTAHLAQVLDFIDHLEAESEASTASASASANGPASAGGRASTAPLTQSTAVRYAAWFHDAVYQIHRAEGAGPTNEERSARLAEDVLQSLGVPNALVTEVGRLVRCTADHRIGPNDHNGAVLCDADLAVLGGDEREYLRYAEQIREEYRIIPDAQFRIGRAAVLRNLLERPAIYHTPRAKALLERKARANIASELDGLTRLT